MTDSKLARDFDQYYTYAQLTEWLQTVARVYPRLCKLIDIGKSYGGKSI